MQIETAQDGALSLLPWIALAATMLLGGLFAIVFSLVNRLRLFDQRLERLDRLEDLMSAVSRLADDQKSLDLRRLEHVLIDIRDGQKRSQDGLLRALELARAEREAAASQGRREAPTGRDLSERVVNRLLAMDFERIQVVTPLADIEELTDGDGEILVEARKNGALCKGRVLVRGGTLTDVQLRPAYTVFP